MSIVDEIRKAMGTDTRTSDELSKATGIHPVNLRQFRAGTRNLPLEKLEALAESLGLEVVTRQKKQKG